MKSTLNFTSFPEIYLPNVNLPKIEMTYYLVGDVASLPLVDNFPLDPQEYLQLPLQEDAKMFYNPQYQLESIDLRTSSMMKYMKLLHNRNDNIYEQSKENIEMIYKYYDNEKNNRYSPIYVESSYKIPAAIQNLKINGNKDNFSKSQVIYLAFNKHMLNDSYKIRRYASGKFMQYPKLNIKNSRKWRRTNRTFLNSRRSDLLIRLILGY